MLHLIIESAFKNKLKNILIFKNGILYLHLSIKHIIYLNY
jgi:hypothetical protein